MKDNLLYSLTKLTLYFEENLTFFSIEKNATGVESSRVYLYTSLPVVRWWSVHAVEGYDVARRDPMCRQQGDEYAEPGDGKVDVEQPGEQLKGVRRPAPTVGPRAEQHVSSPWAVLTDRRRPVRVPTAHVHPERASSIKELPFVVRHRAWSPSHERESNRRLKLHKEPLHDQ